MYNEFDIINNFMVNLYQVDVASTTNLDLTKRYSQLDGVNLKTGHRVILVNQDNKVENDIYQVDSRGYLIITDELAETGRTWRYKAYVKLGDNKGKQFHLINTGNRFPLKGERKDFLDGHGYIIKSLFNYDMFNTGSTVPKLVFTDYELARISLNKNRELYDGFKFLSHQTNNYYPDDISSSVSGYNQMNTNIPINPEVDLSVTITGTSEHYISSFITNDIGVQFINPGAWRFNYYSYIDYTGNTSLVARIYIRDVGGSEKEIAGPIISQNITATGASYATLNYVDFTTTGITLTNKTDRLVLKIWAISNVGNTAHFLYAGTNHYSYITTSPFPLNFPNTVEIKYHDNSYIIMVDDDGSKYCYTGNTLAYYDPSGHTIGGTIYNRSGVTYGNETYIETDTNFSSNADVYDYIKLQISGSTNLYLKTFIKRIESTDIVLSDYIPDNILNDYYTGATSTYTLTNLMYSPSTGLTNIMLESFYSKYFDIDIDNNLIPIENPNNVYFDYDGMYFNVTGDTYYTSGFTTGNYYIKYKLYDHLNRINSYLFNTSYSFLITYTLDSFYAEYFDERPNPYTYPATLSDTKGTLIKITPYTSSLVNYFKNHTYVRVSDGAHSYKTLIVDLVPNSHFIIETPRANSNMTISTISTIYNLKEVSDILYDVYLNDLITGTTDDYYRLRDDDMIRNICNGYASFISEDIGIIDNVTAFLMQDDQHKFILKIYDPENSFNGGISRLPYVITRLDNTIGSSAAQLGGEIISDGGASITKMGMCYSADPYNVNKCVQSTAPLGLGVFYCNITGLIPDTTYYYRAYAQNSTGLGISYGEIESFVTGPPEYDVPVVTTNQNNTAHSHYLTLGGNVIDKNYTDIIVRGIIIQTGSTTPTTGDTLIVYSPENGEIGEYWVDATGLTHDSLYSYAAFATNICGTTYGSTYEVNTLYPAPPVTVIDGIDNVTYESFDVLLNLISNDGLTDGSNIADPVHGVREMGVAYSTANDMPTTGDTLWCYTPPYAIGSFTVSITGLTANTQFYVRGYAQNSLYTGATWTPSGLDTTAYSSNMKSFPTLPLPVAPTLVIDNISHVTTTADIHTSISYNGGSSILEKGLYWSTGNTVDSACTFESATGTTGWYANLTGLTSLTEYSIMSMAANAFATGYTTATGFTTLPVQTAPTGVTLVISPVTPTGATATGNVTFDGYSNITQRGVQYSGGTSWLDWVDGTGIGMWISNITGLTTGTTYWARSYATNSIGTTYSSDPTEEGTAKEFTTPTGHIPPVFDASSPVISSIGISTAVVTSTIINDGGDLVTSRGILYSGTTGGWLNWIDAGTGIGTYGIVITGLTSGSPYYVRSYAVNSEGTGYSNKISLFNTLTPTAPTIQMDSVTDITISGATLNSNITSDGNSPITDRGCWISGGTTPVIYWPDSYPASGTFSSAITGLTQATNYTGKSYATNIVGSSWSNEKYFRTLPKNDVVVDLFLNSDGSPTYVYQIGDVKNIFAGVSVFTNNLMPSELYGGDIVFTTGITIGSWGTGITSYTASPYSYSPLTVETKYFTANESCGIPTENKSKTKQVDAVYPYLTCNRIPYPTPPGGPIPSASVMAQLCSSGNFYTGEFQPKYEVMLKKIELSSIQKTYYYNVTGNSTNGYSNLIYLAHPTGATYGTLDSITVEQISTHNITYPTFTTYASQQMLAPQNPPNSKGIPNSWQVLYNVYAFQVPQNIGQIWVTYNFVI